MKIKRRHVFAKLLWQCFLVAVEFGGISYLFYHLTNKVVPCITLIDVIERFFFGLAIYEFLIFITLTYINDARKDALLALKTAYEKAVLCCENNSEDIRNALLNKISKQLDSGMLNHTDIRSEYEILQSLIESKNLIALKDRQISVEHSYEYVGLQWRYTVLLRLFK